MRFLRRNKYVLVFLAALVFAALMVVHQVLANQSAHVELREDLIVLLDRQEDKPAERVYQMIIQQLPRLSDLELVNDLQRLTLLQGTNAVSEKSLLWKLHVSVNNELRKRAERRLATARERALAR